MITHIKDNNASCTGLARAFPCSLYIYIYIYSFSRRFYPKRPPRYIPDLQNSSHLLFHSSILMTSGITPPPHTHTHTHIGSKMDAWDCWRDPMVIAETEGGVHLGKYITTSVYPNYVCHLKWNFAWMKAVKSSDHLNDQVTVLLGKRETTPSIGGNWHLIQEWGKHSTACFHQHQRSKSGLS